ncbi:unknown; predicted coding region [Mycoplasmopsis pulmonis]|uniref:SIS domain-containing protein n=1 Tax=Mycoplasmopsis pulmonis (strain UAB CTIP) TaxID=272635 RepID=Q98QJ4_MYCPU|nr:hypothetical protein [Mycoplasmopsis pulmonis]CAC13540.1 unknown; predicted coding region [Mycoplasmopsis pulmonis]VEU68129.1 Uncharacterised protein [Mycoplasmopsis pulmonis]
MSNGLNSLGFFSSVAKSIHEVFLWMKNVDLDSILILIFSKSALNHEVMFLINALKEHKINSILITTNKNIISENNFCTIHFETIEQRYRSTALSSRINQFLIADIILKKLFYKLDKKQENEIFKKFNDQWINKGQK